VQQPLDTKGNQILSEAISFIPIKNNKIINKSRKERCFPPQAQAGSPFFSALRSGLRNKGLQAFNGIALGE